MHLPKRLREDNPLIRVDRALAACWNGNDTVLMHNAWHMHRRQGPIFLPVCTNYPHHDLESKN